MKGRRKEFLHWNASLLCWSALICMPNNSNQCRAYIYSGSEEMMVAQLIMELITSLIFMTMFANVQHCAGSWDTWIESALLLFLMTNFNIIPQCMPAFLKQSLPVMLSDQNFIFSHNSHSTKFFSAPKMVHVVPNM